jgi:hypothetical protein
MAQIVKIIDDGKSVLIRKIADDFINRCVAEKGYYTEDEFIRYNRILDNQ